MHKIYLIFAHTKQKMKKNNRINIILSIMIRATKHTLEVLLREGNIMAGEKNPDCEIIFKNSNFSKSVDLFICDMNRLLILQKLLHFLIELFQNY